MTTGEFRPECGKQNIGITVVNPYFNRKYQFIKPIYTAFGKL